MRIVYFVCILTIIANGFYFFLLNDQVALIGTRIGEQTNRILSIQNAVTQHHQYSSNEQQLIKTQISSITNKPPPIQPAATQPPATQPPANTVTINDQHPHYCYIANYQQKKLTHCCTQHYSQEKEDEIMYNFLWSEAVRGKGNELRKGVFIEVGGLDGVSLSTTLWLERCLDWRGMLIEATPNAYKALVKNRPYSTNIPVAVSDKPGTINFTKVEGGVGGIPDHMGKTFKNAYYGNKKLLTDTLTVPSLPMSSILEMYGVNHIDFFSVDVESAELILLSTVDFSKVTVDAMIVESYLGEPVKVKAVRDLLAKNGFVFFPGKMRINDVFVHKRYIEKYKIKTP